MTTIDEGHGRHERRTFYVTPLPESMQSFATDWKKLTSIGQAINISFRDGREVADIRYFILSLHQVKRFAAAVRGRWSIENSLHWTLDMTFREDDSRIRKDHGPVNFATLRRTALRRLGSYQAGQDKSKGSVK